MFNDPIQLEIGLNAITSYRRLAYTAWYAIAEFVDNSTQSFYNNETELRRCTLDTERPLTVRIEYDRERDYFAVIDNAMGMDLDELRNAMCVARPPSNTNGRSKYGMGLKTGASWIGNFWRIKTKKLGHTAEYIVTVDVESVARGNNQLDLTVNDSMPEGDHYTVIEIGKHNRKFHTRTLSKIGDYLSSMYREDFRKSVLSLFWQGEVLTWKEIDEELLKDREGENLKKYFDFSIVSADDDGNSLPKQVIGWVGVLQEGSRSKAGFSILHSGRVVRGWPDAWRPESLYGQIQGSNDLINQRLVGEIHLDDFDVSHTKDDILWLGDEEDLVQEQLRLHCGNFREIARTYRRSREDERGPAEAAIRTAVDRLRRELRSPEMADLIGSNPMLPESLVEEVVEAVKHSVVGRFPETYIANIEGIQVRGYVDEMSVNDPYLTIDTANREEVIIIVNASHPHWKELKGSDGVLNYLRHCTYDGIAEAQARDRSFRSARINPNTVKLFKDRLLRVPLEIEQNSQSSDEDSQTDTY